jgi:hypothetical protein
MQNEKPLVHMVDIFAAQSKTRAVAVCGEIVKPKEVTTSVDVVTCMQCARGR